MNLWRGNRTNLRGRTNSSTRLWLLFGTGINAMILFPAAYMAINAVALAMNYPESGFILAVALLFQVLPAFCLLCPFAAWRIHRKRPEDLNAVIMVFAPLVYAAFLVVFLLST
jgi:hypothetical protein